MKTITKFIANIRRKLFAANVEREIYHKIFSHLNGHADHGYPFTNDNGLSKARLEGSISARNMLVEIDQAARKMPQAEGEAFRFIATRDLNERMAMYLKFAQDREYPAQCTPRLVASAA